MTRLSVIAVVALTLLGPGILAGANPAQAQQKLSIPTLTPPALPAFLRHESPAATVTGELTLPKNASGPVPAMVLLHGSGGLQGPSGANIKKWAGTLNDWGVATFLVDSFGPRGVTSTVADQSKLSSWGNVADGLAALKVLGADSRVNRNRIGVMGWSRGGTAAINSVLETVRRIIIADDLKFAVHVVFSGAAELRNRDRATDQSPILFFHGESDNYTRIGPVHEFADWAQSKGSPVDFVSYPSTYHDFDVQGGGFSGVSKSTQVFTKCDMVVDVSIGRVIRLNHVDNPNASPEAVRAYLGSCPGHGANYAFNPTARANAVEKIHDFLKQYLQISG
jgi:dienelactone hydrolase